MQPPHHTLHKQIQEGNANYVLLKITVKTCNNPDYGKKKSDYICPLGKGADSGLGVVECFFKLRFSFLPEAFPPSTQQ